MVDSFKELPFCNKYIEKPNIKHLKNSSLFSELPFYEELNVTKTSHAFRGYTMNYKVALVIMMMMMNYFCGMVDRRKAFSLISSWDHCQRSSPSRISDTPQAGFEPAQNLNSGLVE